MTKTGIVKEFNRYIETIEEAVEDGLGRENPSNFKRDALKPFSPHERKLIAEEIKEQKKQL